MSANNALHIAVLGGDGIGPEVMAPALEVLRKIEASTDLRFRFTDAPAGANNYKETGKSMPESTVRLCDEADAILLGACGLPSVRYPDNTEIMPQVELRFHFDLYAGVRPARLIPAFLWTFIWSLHGTLKLHNLSFLGSDQMDNLLKDHT